MDLSCSTLSAGICRTCTSRETVTRYAGGAARSCGGGAISAIFSPCQIKLDRLDAVRCSDEWSFARGCFESFGFADLWLLFACFGNTRIVGSPHQRAARDFHHQVLPSMAIHPFPHTHLPVLCHQARLVILSDEIVQVVVSFEDDISAAATRRARP